MLGCRLLVEKLGDCICKAGKNFHCFQIFNFLSERGILGSFKFQKYYRY